MKIPPFPPLHFCVTAMEKEPVFQGLLDIKSPILVEAGGIEPPSENTSTQVSPSAVCLLGFPSHSAGKQAMCYGILLYTNNLKEPAKGVHH